MPQRDDIAAVRDSMVWPVLSPTATLRRLGVRDERGMPWLREHGLIREVAGRQVCSWRQVIAVIEGGAPPSATTEPEPPSRRRGPTRTPTLKAL